MPKYMQQSYKSVRGTGVKTRVIAAISIILFLAIAGALGYFVYTKYKADSANTAQFGNADAYEQSVFLQSKYINDVYGFALDIPRGLEKKDSAGGTVYASKDNDYYIVVDQYTKNGSDKYKYSIASIKNSGDIVQQMILQVEAVTSIQHNTKSRKITFSETKKLTVGGYDMLRHEGYMETPKEKVAKNNVITYATFYEGFPVYFMIVDTREDQTSNQNIETIIDAMAKTFRKYVERSNT